VDIQRALRGLEYSETLAYASKKRYRDHLAHSCRVALYGLDSMESLQFRDMGPDNVHHDSSMRCACWLYISLLHDCGYVLEHLDYLLGLVGHLADTATLRAFDSDLSHARGHLIYALSLATRKDMQLEDKVLSKAVAHPLVSYDNAQRLLGYEAQRSVLRVPTRAIALHHTYEHVPIDPYRYEFWLALLDEFQEWGRAVAIPPDVAHFVQSLLATGGTQVRLLETQGTVEVRDVSIGTSLRNDGRVPKDDQFTVEVGLNLPGCTGVFAKTLFNPLYFVWDKWYKFNVLGRSAENSFQGQICLSADICCHFSNQDQVDDWGRYFETLEGILKREAEHFVNQLKVAPTEQLLGARHIDTLQTQRELSGALLVLCCGLDRGVKEARLGTHSICRLRVEKSPAEKSHVRTMEFHRAYGSKGQTSWLSIEEVAKQVAAGTDGLEATDIESLVKPTHRESVRERILELHEAALGSLVGRHQAKEIVEKYHRAPWGDRN